MRVCETDNKIVVQLLDHLYLVFEILPPIWFYCSAVHALFAKIAQYSKVVFVVVSTWINAFVSNSKVKFPIETVDCACCF